MKKFVLAVLFVLCVASVVDAGCIFGRIRERAQNRRQNGLGANLRGDCVSGEHYHGVIRGRRCAGGICY